MNDKCTCDWCLGKKNTKGNCIRCGVILRVVGSDDGGSLCFKCDITVKEQFLGQVQQHPFRLMGVALTREDGAKVFHEEIFPDNMKPTDKCSVCGTSASCLIGNAYGYVRFCGAHADLFSVKALEYKWATEANTKP